ncbi:nitrilase-related carbon-nitrogen hydrolase [Pengzhenrongella sp.]|uniref:nitrilase-related carbon-nitrogen hydrolase n=1 Tax=Pengzhenrongella sp. TaxID=2888820 RepID=UPI002F93EE80
MRIAVLQETSAVGSFDANLELLEHHAGRASEAGADLLVTPELFTCGYAPAAVHQTDGAPHRRRIADMARRYGVAIVASTVEHQGDDHFISASLFGARGDELTRYRKQHLFGPAEKAVFSPGTDAPAQVVLGGFTVSLGICFDIEFPEFVRQAALAGTEILCVPTAVPVAADFDESDPLTFDERLVPSMVVPTRALESQLFLAYANHAGPGFAGLSSVCSPLGRRLASAGDGPELILAEVRSETLDAARTAIDYLASFAPHRP